MNRPLVSRAHSSSSTTAHHRRLLRLPKRLCLRVAGVPLVVLCICMDAQTEHFYLCFACEDCFPQWGLHQHFTSQHHLIRTLVSPRRLVPRFSVELESAGFLVLSSLTELVVSPSALLQSLAPAFCLGGQAGRQSHAVHDHGGGEGTRSGSHSEGEQRIFSLSAAAVQGHAPVLPAVSKFHFIS